MTDCPNAQLYAVLSCRVIQWLLISFWIKPKLLRVEYNFYEGLILISLLSLFLSLSLLYPRSALLARTFLWISEWQALLGLWLCTSKTKTLRMPIPWLITWQTLRFYLLQSNFLSAFILRYVPMSVLSNTLHQIYYSTYKSHVPQYCRTSENALSFVRVVRVSWAYQRIQNLVSTQNLPAEWWMDKWMWLDYNLEQRTWFLKTQSEDFK